MTYFVKVKDKEISKKKVEEKKEEQLVDACALKVDYKCFRRTHKQSVKCVFC